MKFNTSNTGIKLISSFEGLSLKAYKPVPTEKYYTIGYGHYGPDVKKDMKITEAKAKEYLKKDLATAERAVNSYNLSWMNQNKFDALVSFTYNCGSGSLRTLLNNGKRTEKEVASHIPLYTKAGGRELAGLVRRRKAELELFNAGPSDTENKKTTKCSYYKKYTGESESIDVILKAIGCKTYGSVEKRRAVAVANGIKNYTGTAQQNIKLINLANDGKLIK